MLYAASGGGTLPAINALEHKHVNVSVYGRPPRCMNILPVHIMQCEGRRRAVGGGASSSLMACAVRMRRLEIYPELHKRRMAQTKCA